MNLTICISGSGSNLLSILEAIDNDILRATVIKVIADRECQGINHAIARKIPVEIIHPKKMKSELLAAIPTKTNYIVLAGFLSIIPQSVLQAFPKRIINIHPSLLPKYGGKGMYGLHVHNAVINDKEKESGCTVHFVEKGIDTGQSIMQRTVTVLPEDTPETLQKKILFQEHQLYIKAIQFLELLHRMQLPNLELGKGKYSQAFLARGIDTFYEAIIYVKNLPYQRNSQYKPSMVLQEHRGVCSTKHALIHKLAIENNIKTTLIIGIFGMNQTNTPQIAHLLQKYNLQEIPEAHTYLMVNNTRLDITTSESFTTSFMHDLKQEFQIECEDIPNRKIKMHQQFLQEYINSHHLPYTLQELWAIREECIYLLSTT